jgi:hypothetical protein
MFFIQGLLCVYNKHLQSNQAKKKTLLMACIEKTTINIHGTTIHSSLSISLNCKDSSSLNFKWLDSLIKKR